MTPKFQHSLSQKDDVTYVKIGGVIDEDNELGPLSDKMTTSTTVIDLSEIERINSCGVRDWVNWLGKIEKQGAKKIVFVQCSPSIVAQINLVSNFTGSGSVKSFYAPFFCPNCDREKQLLVETRDIAGRQPFKAPTCRCDECDGVMDFDDMEDSFFAFLANSKKIATDAVIEAAVSEFTPSTGEKKLRLKSNPAMSTGVSTPGTPGGGNHAAVAGNSGSMPSMGGMTRTGTGSGSSFPSNRSQTGSGAKWPPPPSDDLTRRLMPAPSEPRSAGAWILVGVLVAAAVALLAYVFLSGGPKPTLHGGAAETVPSAAAFQP